MSEIILKQIFDNFCFVLFCLVKLFYFEFSIIFSSFFLFFFWVTEQQMREDSEKRRFWENVLMYFDLQNNKNPRSVRITHAGW